jgi:hypothetical protein
MDKPSTSTRSSAVSFRDIGSTRVLGTSLRCSPGLVNEFSTCIDADLGSETLESEATNAESIASSVRFVL